MSLCYAVVISVLHDANLTAFHPYIRRGSENACRFLSAVRRFLIISHFWGMGFVPAV